MEGNLLTLERVIVLHVALGEAEGLENTIGVTSGRRQEVFFNFLPLFPKYMNYSPFGKSFLPKKDKIHCSN
ncbi:50S ribosomal protein L37e [Thermococcus sibiricus MM 739]|uniref:50S ribosomal protein L37e n=1 Tax=Thermococcus sibiricus (strain DSM 12597 / MM 739) TaxID=604354 RepID=C6A1T3_THESM|nr:50S ribosomal protein L37e [Thermococcus sibiricus MM 739]